MRIALTMLDIADAAVFLPDWSESEGAREERAYCQRVKKPEIEWEERTCSACVFQDDWRCHKPLGAELTEEQCINVSPEDYCSAWEPGF